MRILLAAALWFLLAACSTAQEGPPLTASAPPGSPVAEHGALAVRGGKVVGWLADDWQVDIVRASIAAEGNDSARQHFDRELAKASTVIEAAAANGIYVIVDWHAHRPYPDEAERFLVAIAQKYGHLPNLIYEPFNEPLRDGVDWSRDVKPYHQRMIAAIRAADPDNLIVVGSPSWSQDVDIAALDPLEGENIAYTLHYYAATHKGELRAKADKALAAGLALFVTEFGVVEATGDGPIDHASSEAWWDWAEANDISWLAWSIGDRDETSATLKPGTPPANWSEDDLTESGKLLRSRLRAAAAAEDR